MDGKHATIESLDAFAYVQDSIEVANTPIIAVVYTFDSDQLTIYDIMVVSMQNGEVF